MLKLLIWSADMNKIELFQNSRNWQDIREDVLRLVDEDNANGLAQNTQLVQRLEARLAEQYGRAHCVTTASCTDALVIALVCLNLPQGALVAMTNYTFIATAHAIRRAGYQVHTVDVNDNYCIDPTQIPAEARAVVVADMFGNMSNWSELHQLGVPIINDAAQSMESRNGTWSVKCGDISCVSFSPSKPISSWGSGGALFTDNIQVAARAKALRLHGRYHSKHAAHHTGLNSMINSFEAAAVWACLDRSDAWHHRREHIARYLACSTKITCATDFDIERNGFQKLVFQTNDQSGYIQHLYDHGVATTIHYLPLINDEPLYHRDAVLTRSRELCQKSFTVPNQHTLTDEEVEQIAKALK